MRGGATQSRALAIVARQIDDRLRQTTAPEGERSDALVDLLFGQRPCSGRRTPLAAWSEM